MKIAVVGTGYVGLVTGTCFAETGNDVICIDTDAKKVKKLSSGEITIYEPGLNKLFLRNLKEERLSLRPIWQPELKRQKSYSWPCPHRPGLTDLQICVMYMGWLMILES